MKPILVSAKEAAGLLGISTFQVYELASGGVLEKRYIGNGRRNFRLTYESVERYANDLPSEPIADSA